MTRRIKAEGGTLLEAVAEGIAELARCESDEVDLKINAPGFDPEAEQLVKVLLEIAPPEENGEEEDDDSSKQISAEQLDEEAEAAADFMEGLLDILSLPGDLKLRVFDDHAEVEVVEVGSGALIGRRGQTLEAIQELVRCSLQRQFQRRARVKIDVEGYRDRRLEKFKEKASEVIERVQDGGEAERLEPMDVFERKAIHRLVAEHDGVSSRSQGREPGRRVIIEQS